MRAIRVHKAGGPEVLKLDDSDIPEPVDRQVLVKVMSVGVNPVETYIRSSFSGSSYVPGTDGAGTVHRLGNGVGNLKVGQKVFFTGTLTGSYAQYALCDEKSVKPLHDSLSFDQGAAIGIPYYTAYTALFHSATTRKSDFVFIDGASGAVGIACIQLCVWKGIKVAGSAGSEEGINMLKNLGANLVVDHHSPDYLSKVKEWTSNNGIDVVIEMCSHFNLGRILEYLAIRGRVAVVGSRRPVEIDARNLMTKRSSIHGVYLYLLTEQEYQEADTDIQEGLENGALIPIIGKRFPLSRASEAHSEIINPSNGARGKIVLLPWEN